jgi:hypothetical protein
MILEYRGVPGGALGGISTGLQQGVSIAEDVERIRERRKLAEQQRQMQPLIQQYAESPQEDRATLSQIAAIDPQKAIQLKSLQAASEKIDREKQEENIKTASTIAATIKAAPTEYKEQSYQQGLQLANRLGIDTSGLPQQYTPDIEPMLDMIVNRGREIEDIIPEEKERKVIKDVAGRQRYQDTGALVFPGVDPSESPEKQEKIAKQASDLRKELTKNSEDFIQIRDSMARIRAVAENPSAAGDVALIFNYMKILDPGSTVREGEFATAENAGSVPARVIAKYNKVMRGERLEESQRKDFVNQSENLYKAQLNSQKKLVNQYTDIAKKYGISPDEVILDLMLENEESQKLEGEETKLASEYTDEEILKELNL